MSERICEFEGCRNRSGTSRLCSTHSNRLARHGDPSITTRTAGNWSIKERLDFYGWTVTNSGCWEWNGPRNPDGYGEMSIRQRTHKIHRVAYEFWVGPIPTGAHIRHRCDNPPCINPDHLTPGTHQQNMADMAARDRSPQGERHWNSKLTDDMVRRMRAVYDSGVSQRVVAEMFNAAPSSVSLIVRRKAWTHVL